MVDGGPKILQENFGEMHLKELDLNPIYCNYQYNLYGLGKSLNFLISPSRNFIG